MTRIIRTSQPPHPQGAAINSNADARETSEQKQGGCQNSLAFDQHRSSTPAPPKSLWVPDREPKDTCCTHANTHAALTCIGCSAEFALLEAELGLISYAHRPQPPAASRRPVAIAEDELVEGREFVLSIGGQLLSLVCSGQERWLRWQVWRASLQCLRLPM